MKTPIQRLREWRHRRTNRVSFRVKIPGGGITSPNTYERALLLKRVFGGTIVFDPQ